MTCYFRALFLQTGQDLQALLAGADPAFLASLGDMEAGTVWNCRVRLVDMSYLCFAHLYPLVSIFCFAESECQEGLVVLVHAVEIIGIHWIVVVGESTCGGSCRGFLDLWADLGPWMVLVDCHSEGQLLEWREVPRTALAVKSWTVMYSLSTFPL